MADHPLRAALAWPIVLGIGLVIALLAAFVLAAILLIGFRVAAKGLAYLDDDESEAA